MMQITIKETPENTYQVEVLVTDTKAYIPDEVYFTVVQTPEQVQDIIIDALYGGDDEEN